VRDAAVERAVMKIGALLQYSTGQQLPWLAFFTHRRLAPNPSRHRKQYLGREYSAAR
jgi:hypothetical protein